MTPAELQELKALLCRWCGEKMPMSLIGDMFHSKSGLVNDRHRYRCTASPAIIAKVNEWLEGAVDKCVDECARHAQFCKTEMLNGGDVARLSARMDEAGYLAERIRKILTRRESSREH